MSARVIQIDEARTSLRFSKLLPRILARKDEIIDNVCKATTEYGPEWFEIQLEKNFESIVRLILSGDTETPLLGKIEVRNELKLLGIIS